MRALAHPVRLALLDHLHTVEQATATECATVVGDSPSSCSYHLRALAKWGFVGEAEGGVGRERPWRARRRGSSSARTGSRRSCFATSSSHGSSSDCVTALRNEHELPPRWRRAAQTSSATLELTPRELEELGERFEQLLDEFRGRERGGDPPGTRFVRRAAES